MKWLIFILFIILTACAKQQVVPQVCFEGDCLEVELAQTPSEWKIGLMNRTTLEEGMLFVYPQESVYMFWMKNTLIPLDMIWLSESGEVLYIQENAPPCEIERCPTYSGNDILSKYVLEVPGGYTLEQGIKVGDVLDIEI